MKKLVEIPPEIFLEVCRKGFAYFPLPDGYKIGVSKKDLVFNKEKLVYGFLCDFGEYAEK